MPEVRRSEDGWWDGSTSRSAPPTSPSITDPPDCHQLGYIRQHHRVFDVPAVKLINDLAPAQMLGGIQAAIDDLLPPHPALDFKPSKEDGLYVGGDIRGCTPGSYTIAVLGWRNAPKGQCIPARSNALGTQAPHHFPRPEGTLHGLTGLPWSG